MTQEVIIPVKWESWDQQDTLLNSYYDAEFTEDFGPFVKGEKFSSISIDYSKGVVEGYNEEGTEVIKSCKFKAQVI